METPELPTFPYTSGRSSGSKPYNVTESNAVDKRVAGIPTANRWNRWLVRAGPPSPANIRAGSSPSRLNGNTPAVNGKRPGRFSDRSHRVRSPRSLNRGNATRGTLVPDNDSLRSTVVVVRPAAVDTSSSPEKLATVVGHSSRRARTEGWMASPAWATRAGSVGGASPPNRCPAHSNRSSSRTCSACTSVTAWYARTASAISPKYRARALGTRTDTALGVWRPLTGSTPGVHTSPCPCSRPSRY